MTITTLSPPFTVLLDERERPVSQPLSLIPITPFPFFAGAAKGDVWPGWGCGGAVTRRATTRWCCRTGPSSSTAAGAPPACPLASWPTYLPPPPLLPPSLLLFRFHSACSNPVCPRIRRPCRNSSQPQSPGAMFCPSIPASSHQRLHDTPSTLVAAPSWGVGGCGKCGQHITPGPPCSPAALADPTGGAGYPRPAGGRR